MTQHLKRISVLICCLFCLFTVMPGRAFAQNSGATVYFANNVVDSAVRYAAVSVRKHGESQWQYSDYFAPLSYEETSRAFLLEDGSYEYVMSISFKKNITEIEGTFTVTNGVVGELASNALSGAELQQNDQGEFLIIAGSSVDTSSVNANSVFFKVLQPAGLTPDQIENGVSFYTERGVKMGVYNFNSGTVSILLPTVLHNGTQDVAQTFYSYEVNLPGYAPARGTVCDLSNSNYSTRYTWTEDENYKAESIVNSQTGGYQVYLSPAVQGTKTVNFSISGDAEAQVELKNEAGEALTPSGEGQYAIPIPDTGSAAYTYTLSGASLVTLQGSFTMDTAGTLTDTTTVQEQEKAISYEFKDYTYSIQPSPLVAFSSSGTDGDGRLVVSLPSNVFSPSWYPGVEKEGTLCLTNDTQDTYTVTGYNICIQDGNGDYRMQNILRAANKAVCDLYGWNGREGSTLYGLVHVTDKIAEVYGQNPEYLASYDLTYSDYLLYYYKTNYPEQYASIQSLEELSAEHQYEIFAQYNNTDDCWYDGGPGDAFGDEFDDAAINAAVTAGQLYSDGGRYGALELDPEVDQLAKAIAFRDGFSYSFNTAVTPIETAPSLLDWAIKNPAADQAFAAFAENFTLAPGESCMLDKIGLKLNGGAFSNCFQVVTWDYSIQLLLEKENDLNYKVLYQFVSGTPDKDLPQTVTSLLPVDNNPYLPGSTVTAQTVPQTTVPEGDGEWVFQGWDRNTVENIQADVQFTGIWVYQTIAPPATSTPTAPPETGPTSTPEPITPPTPSSQPTSNTAIPQTGDNTFWSFWLIAMLISCAGIVVTFAIKRLREH